MRRYIKDIFTGEYRWVEDEGGRTVYSKAERPKRAFYIVPDIEPFVSPIDDTVVGGRRQKRDHMRVHGVEEAGDIKRTPRKRVEMPPIGEDIRAAIEMVRSGNAARAYDGWDD